MKRVGLMAVLVALFSPAIAAAEGIAPGRAVLVRPQVPPIPEGVGVEVDPDMQAVAAAGPNTIYLRGDEPLDQYDWLHEMGHVYDFRCMSAADHATFVQLIGHPRMPWAGHPYPVNSAAEWFADAMAQLWRLHRPGIIPTRVYSIGEGTVRGSQLIEVAHYLTD